MAKNTAKTASDTPDETVVHSWLPEEYRSGAKTITAEQWKPEPGDVRVFTLTGFEKRHSETLNSDFLLYTGTDDRTGETFSFLPGALFDYFMEKSTIAIGDKIAIRYKGEKKLDSGFNAKQWDIVKIAE